MHDLLLRNVKNHLSAAAALREIKFRGHVAFATPAIAPDNRKSASLSDHAACRCAITT
jgi:hypothetical protein